MKSRRKKKIDAPPRKDAAGPSAGSKRRKAVSPPENLLSYQRRWVEDKSRFKIGLMARQTGKDFSSGAEGIKDCYHASLEKKAVTWLIAAPSERQSLESLEKWKEWARAYDLSIAQEYVERPNPKNSESLIKSATITFPHGSRVIAVPGRPDTVRGFSANILATEFAYFEDPDATWRALLPSITNPMRGGPKKCRLISTPNGIGNKFHELWRKNFPSPSPEGEGRSENSPNTISAPGTHEPDASEQTPHPGLLPFGRGEGDRSAALPTSEVHGEGGRPAAKWSCHKVTISDAVAQGLPINVDELREALDDPEGWAQEYDPLDFLDLATVLLPYELIAGCENANAAESCPPDFWQASLTGSPIFAGIDFGRRRDLTVFWALQLLAGAFKLTVEVLCLDNTPTPDQIEILRPRIRLCRRVCLDYTGPGIGLGDFLAKEFGEYNPARHLFGKIELCTFTNALKTEIFPKLRMEFEGKRLGVPINRAIREDIHSISRVALAAGGMSYRAPHTPDGHADRCTALALAVRAAGAGAQGIVTAAGIRTGGGHPAVRPPRIVPARIGTLALAGRPSGASHCTRLTENGAPIL